MTSELAQTHLLGLVSADVEAEWVHMSFLIMRLEVGGWGRRLIPRGLGGRVDPEGQVDLGR